MSANDLPLSMHRRDRSESGYMQHFILLMSAVIILSLALFTLVIPPSYTSGAVAFSSVKVPTANLAIIGPVTAYADMPGMPENTELVPSPQSRSGMSTVQVNIQLATLLMNWEPGTGDDFSQATVVMVTPGGSETLPRRTTPPLSRPGWSIVNKSGVLPGTTANANDLLEPNEQFTLIVSPQANLPAGTPFFITIRIPGVQPLTIGRSVPVPLRPVMDLG